MVMSPRSSASAHTIALLSILKLFSLSIYVSSERWSDHLQLLFTYRNPEARPAVISIPRLNLGSDALEPGFRCNCGLEAIAICYPFLSTAARRRCSLVVLARFLIRASYLVQSQPGPFAFLCIHLSLCSPFFQISSFDRIHPLFYLAGHHS